MQYKEISKIPHIIYITIITIITAFQGGILLKLYRESNIGMEFLNDSKNLSLFVAIIFLTTYIILLATKRRQGLTILNAIHVFVTIVCCIWGAVFLWGIITIPLTFIMFLVYKLSDKITDYYKEFYQTFA